jgi:exosortase A-associated hydrolase 2
VGAPAAGFFLQGGAGRTFAMYHAAAAGAPRGQLLVVPPFVEEMNKSRRMLALLARAAARRGVGTLLLDLYGTGESEGDFADARWEIWKDDIVAGLAWLRERGGGWLGLLGERLGALLALDAAREHGQSSMPIFLWQPTLNGTTALTQFLRMRMMSSLARAGSGESTDDLRRELANRRSVEVGGYELHPQLARQIDGLRLEELAGERAAPIHWFELVSEPGRAISLASRRAIDTLRGRGVEVREAVALGPPFWSAVEIAEATALIDATCAAFDVVVPA